MCGRFMLTAPPEDVAREFEVEVPPSYRPRTNIRPTEEVLVIRRQSGAPNRTAALLRWGLIPHWAKDPAIAAKLINARAETAAEKPSFRDSFRRRRCLLPATGFYEWQDTGGRRKQPYLIRRHDGRLFALAGLWDRWFDPEGTRVETCTILTTEPNDVVRPIHNRMPVIIAPQHYDLWLDPSASHAEKLQALLAPFAESELLAEAIDEVR
ncbi:MAG: SOS response-associated peptidase [Candidatus Dadabacteria bacterium]|nr:MAG: SOS response-associated peptidase [Candidatus Dadabacteria bacterium]